jgi:hypothetical protein
MSELLGKEKLMKDEARRFFEKAVSISSLWSSRLWRQDMLL